MKNNIVSIALFMIVALCIVSCQKEPVEPSIDEVIWQDMYDHLELGCEEQDIDDYFKATIDGVECCYYDGVDNMKMQLSYNGSDIFFKRNAPLFF